MISALYRNPLTLLQIGQQSLRSSHQRRILRPASACIPVQLDVMTHDQLDDENERRELQQFTLSSDDLPSDVLWGCELQGDDVTQAGGIYFATFAPGSLSDTFFEDHGIVSGQSTVLFDGATMNVETGELTVPDETNVVVGRPDRKNHNEGRRQLNSNYQGDKTVLVVRIKSTKDGLVTGHSETDLRNGVFGNDNVNLMTIMDDCSHGKLKINPYQGTTTKGLVIQGGITTVEIGSAIQGVDMSLVAGSVLSALTAKAGDLPKQFDHVLLCMPKGVSGVIAYAWASSWLSVYNYGANSFCLSPSATVHEIGHNLNLAHSALPNQPTNYGDFSGMMGGSSGETDGPQKCYNAAKSWQLGWYSEQQMFVNPAVDGALTATMVGVTHTDPDAGKNIVVRVENGDTDIYIGYNHATSFNSGTETAQANKVLVYEKDDIVYTQSYRVASLDVGGEYRLPNYMGSGQDLAISFQSRKANRDEAVVKIWYPNCDACNARSTPQECQPNEVLFDLEVKTDRYGGEFAWTLKNSRGESVLSGSRNDYSDANKVYNLPKDQACIPMSEVYTFEASDFFGDGMCCSQGQGYYVAHVNGATVFDGGAFQSTVSHQFQTCDYCAADEMAFAFELETDAYPGDTSWSLKRGNQVLQQKTVGDYIAKYTVHVEEPICIKKKKCYDFKIEDAFGDGLKIGFNGIDYGYYAVKLDGAVEFTNRAFGEEEAHHFCAGQKLPVSPVNSLCEQNYSLLEFSLKTDGYPGDTGVELADNDSEWIQTIPAGTFSKPYTTYSPLDLLCLPPGNCYTLTVSDAYGDGLSAGRGGSFTGKKNSQTIFTGGANFGKKSSHEICA